MSNESGDKDGQHLTHWVVPCASAEEAKAELAKMVDNTEIVNGYNLHFVGWETPEKVLVAAVTGCGPLSDMHAESIVARSSCATYCDPAGLSVAEIEEMVAVYEQDGAYPLSLQAWKHRLERAKAGQSVTELQEVKDALARYVHHHGAYLLSQDAPLPEYAPISAAEGPPPSTIVQSAVDHLIWQVEHNESFDRSVMLKALSMARAATTPLCPCDRTWAKCQGDSGCPRGAVSATERITEVVGADGKGVAAPCAISGCALMSGEALLARSARQTHSEEKS